MGHDLRVHFKTCRGSLKRKGKGNPRKKGLRGSLTITQDDLGFLSRNGITGKLPRFANRIKLKIDEERQRISLGMKKSYLEDGGSVDRTVDVDADRKDDHQNGASSIDNPFLELQHSEDIADGGGPEIFAQPGKNTSVLPLQVSLEESEDSDVDNPEIVNKNDANDNGQLDKKDRRAKKKAEEEKELEISASEERRLQNDIPMTEDEFEKLVRSSPNSSFVWINYMAFMLRLADIRKARDIAERALNIINIREEGEKFNVWVAYLNLENEYGNPPEVAVKEVFQRALQYCDPKKLHLALLGVYERTKQQNLAEELLERMTKKFKQSCKVWLRCIQNFLMNNKDETKLIVNRALLSLPRKMTFGAFTLIRRFVWVIQK